MKRLLFLGMALAVLFGLAKGSATMGVWGAGPTSFHTYFDAACTDRVDVAGWGLETDDGLVYNVRFEPLPEECFGSNIAVVITSDGSAAAWGGARIDEVWDHRVRFGPVPAEAITDLHVLIGSWELPSFPWTCPWDCTPCPSTDLGGGTGWPLSAGTQPR